MPLPEKYRRQLIASHEAAAKPARGDTRRECRLQLIPAPFEACKDFSHVRWVGLADRRYDACQCRHRPTVMLADPHRH
jgi:hypothetical protein